MIIDGHGHVSPTTYGCTDRYVEVLKESGIDQGVVSPGGMLDVRKMSDYVSGQKKPDASPRNDYVEDAFRSNRALHGFACVDPRDPQATEKLARHLEGGFRGLLVSPLVHRFSFTDDCMADLAALCGERGAPVISHIAWRPGANTSDYIALARKFPRTNFILEHMGAHPADTEAADAAATLDNLFLETSLGSYLHIVETVKRAGASKVIFGSEYPLSHPAVELKKIQLLPISGRERDKILAANILELLRLAVD
jgi:predicted TIM-barrel fold metal-dependent hydrolase